MSYNEYMPDYVCHPLETVKETLECYGLPFSSLYIGGLDYDYWQGYANGTKPLTERAVDVIGDILGIPKPFIRRLDKQYQESRNQ